MEWKIRLCYFSYPTRTSGRLRALQAFLCTEVSLGTHEILDTYVEKWSVELFFRNIKNRLALDK